MPAEIIKYAIHSLIGGNLEAVQVLTVLLLVIFGITALNGWINLLRKRADKPIIPYTQMIWLAPWEKGVLGGIEYTPDTDCEGK